HLVTEGGTRPAESVDPELQDLEHVVVRIYWSQGRPGWDVNDQPAADFAEVRQKLAAVAAVRTDLPVLIDPQDATPLDWVIQTYDAARAVGFSQVQFAVGDPLAGA